MTLGQWDISPVTWPVTTHQLTVYNFLKAQISKPGTWYWYNTLFLFFKNRIILSAYNPHPHPIRVQSFHEKPFWSIVQKAWDARTSEEFLLEQIAQAPKVLAPAGSMQKERIWTGYMWHSVCEVCVSQIYNIPTSVALVII